MSPEPRSAPLADAVVEAVVFFLNLAIELRRSRRLRNAWPRDSRAGGGLVVLIQKMAGRRLANLRDHKTVILPIRRTAGGRSKQEGGDDYRFCHDQTLANEDRAEIALICLGFKRPTRSNVGEAHLPLQRMPRVRLSHIEIPAVDKPRSGDETSRASNSG